MRSTLVGVALTALALTACQSDWGDDDRGAPTTSTSTTTTTTRPTTTTSKPPPTTATDAATPPHNVTTVAPDGGNDAGQPYPKLPAWNSHTFFPRTVWLERVDTTADCTLLQGLGFNVFDAIQANSKLDVANTCNMYLLAQADELGQMGGAGHPAMDGYLVYDEADMAYGPDNDPWTGVAGWNTCIPIQDQGGQCGYTVMQHYAELIPAGKIRHANYGKGVLEWESDSEASGFVNGGFQDIFSADKYWFTDPHVAAADRKGASYGDDVRRMRMLDGLAGGTAPGDRQPVWAFVELGHPFSEANAPSITPAQTRSAVWHAVIAGARGINYFAHCFNGPCSMVTRDNNTYSATARAAVASLNAQLTQLAPVLNSATATGYVTTSPNVRAVAKVGGSDAPFGAGIYTIAGATWSGGGSQRATITINPAAGPSSGTASVLFEGRTVPIVGGQIVDAFADGNAIHVYKW